jgi:hypothetical protein
VYAVIVNDVVPDDAIDDDVVVDAAPPAYVLRVLAIVLPYATSDLRVTTQVPSNVVDGYDVSIGVHSTFSTITL